MPIASVNPASGALLRRFDPHDSSEIERRLARAAKAAREWRTVPPPERAAVVERVAARLDRDRDEYARLMTLEMGKTITAAREEAIKCALGCRYYAEHGPGMLGPEIIEPSTASAAQSASTGTASALPRGWISYEPLGVVLAIMPWNFPFWQVIRFAAPALVAGNVGLLKHASNVPQCALALEELFQSAGAPEGVFQTLLVGSDVVDDLIADTRVAAVTLTGSTPAGQSVAACAGRHIKKTVLELGGSDPFVVLPSADVERAAKVAVTARTINNGQSCIAAKRFIVHRDIADRFDHAFVEGMCALRVGDPMDPEVQIGPLATESIVTELERQVKQSLSAGGHLLCGGARPKGAGWWYDPTVIADPPRGSPARDDELFGPVAALIHVDDENEALEVANETQFGLGASLWSTRDDEIRRMTVALEAGTVMVNGMVASDPRYPFGGIKASGYGRELSAMGLREFTNVKTVRVGDSAPARGAE